MNQDLHPELGPKVPVADYEEALAIVRSHWPRAWAEGSMGEERSFWVRPAPNLIGGRVINSEPVLVAHYWKGRQATPGKPQRYWLRCKP